MKVLIITAPLGNGHNACAKALKKHYDNLGAECTVLDLYEYISPHLKSFIEAAYFWTMKSAMSVRPLANELYMMNERTEPRAHFITDLQNDILASALCKYIDENRPDIIICTQVYAAQVVSRLRRENKTNALTCAIITDFTVQTYWQDTQNIDYIVTYSPMLSQQCSNRGIPQSKILPVGIPIDEKFSLSVPQDKARRQLGYSRDKFCVLVMSGGMGYGKISRCVQDMDKRFDNIQFVVVCGSNESLYKDMQQVKTKNEMHLLGYSNQVELLMDAADCIVTKPGGITASEALAKHLPIITYDPLPGMEENNVVFLVNMGCAISSEKNFPVELCLGLLINSKTRIKNLKEAMADIAKPNATAVLVDFLEKLYKERS